MPKGLRRNRESGHNRTEISRTESATMKFFMADLRDKTDRHRKIYALYELVYTLIDLGAALLFIIGSILFFYSQLQDAGTWCFLVGSVFFAAKPMLRVVREFHLLAIGDYQDLARRIEE